MQVHSENVRENVGGGGRGEEEEEA